MFAHFFSFSSLFACFCLLLMPGKAVAQCKSFSLSDRGDTLNCVDQKGLKQGPWLEKTAAVRLNPGFEEEGNYQDGLRFGVWRRYTPEGDIISMETYKWGLKHGPSQYFSYVGLEREESWLAIDPDKKYDTLEFPDFDDPSRYQTVVVKNEGRSLRHGKWTWYEPTTGFVQRVEEFVRDSSINPLGMYGISNKPKPAPVDSSGKKTVAKPLVVEEWEKKNSGKKKVRVRDGSTGY